MKRGGPLRRLTPLRAKQWGIKRKPPTEKQRHDRAKLEASKRIIWERSGGRCEFVRPLQRWRENPDGSVSRIVQGCASEAQDPHHISR